jgi:hypothetical protein
MGLFFSPAGLTLARGSDKDCQEKGKGGKSHRRYDTRMPGAFVERNLNRRKHYTKRMENGII